MIAYFRALRRIISVVGSTCLLLETMSTIGWSAPNFAHTYILTQQMFYTSQVHFSGTSAAFGNSGPKYCVTISYHLAVFQTIKTNFMEKMFTENI